VVIDSPSQNWALSRAPSRVEGAQVGEVIVTGRIWWAAGLAVAVALGLTVALPGAFKSTPADADFTPPSNANWVAIDCDLGAPGVQDACSATVGNAMSVGIVVGNVTGIGSPGPVEIGAFNFDLINSDVNIASPQNPSCSAPALNCNPNFNEATVTGAGWSCTPPLPDPDVDTDGNPATTESRHSCITTSHDGP
jgi:hypothetical protein